MGLGWAVEDGGKSGRDVSIQDVVIPRGGERVWNRRAYKGYGVIRVVVVVVGGDIAQGNITTAALFLDFTPPRHGIALSLQPPCSLDVSQCVTIHKTNHSTCTPPANKTITADNNTHNAATSVDGHRTHIKPTATSSTLSLSTKSSKPAQKERTRPRTAWPA